jgi:hypothetical protein
MANPNPNPNPNLNPNPNPNPKPNQAAEQGMAIVREVLGCPLVVARLGLGAG